MNHHEYMEEALVDARRAEANGDVPVGAVVVLGDRIVGRGFNRREADQDPTAHAEVIALRDAASNLGSWRLEECTLYVTLEPCPMCSGALVLSRIQRVVYGCTDPKGGFLGTLADLSNYPGLNHRFEVIGGVMAEECAGSLRQFFREIRKKSKKKSKND